jgi:prophage maintenance system killer protein
MIRYLTLMEVLNLHHQIIKQSTGAMGIRDLGALESAIAQPRMTFGGEDLYPTIMFISYFLFLISYFLFLISYFGHCLLI